MPRPAQVGKSWDLRLKAANGATCAVCVCVCVSIDASDQMEMSWEDEERPCLDPTRSYGSPSASNTPHGAWVLCAAAPHLPFWGRQVHLNPPVGIGV